MHCGTLCRRPWAGSRARGRCVNRTRPHGQHGGRRTRAWEAQGSVQRASTQVFGNLRATTKGRMLCDLVRDKNSRRWGNFSLTVTLLGSCRREIVGRGIFLPACCDIIVYACCVGFSRRGSFIVPAHLGWEIRKLWCRHFLCFSCFHPRASRYNFSITLISCTQSSTMTLSSHFAPTLRGCMHPIF